MASMAYDTYQQIRNLAAFTIKGHNKSRNVNQHLRIYTFPDNSELWLYASGKALVPHEIIGTYKGGTA